jgi:hypothetical protein
LNNQLLISTMLNLIHYDGENYHIVHTGQLSEGTAHYNGITWDENEILVSACKDFKYIILVLDKLFNVKYYLDQADLHETHQIIIKKDNLYCVNTGKNRIEILTSSGWKNKSFNPSPCDIDHLNGIWFDNNYFYISEFRHRHNDKKSVVRICDFDLNLLDTIKVGLPIHNVYVENGLMYNVISREAGIYQTDLLTLTPTKHIPLSDLQGYLLRGLARTRDRWYIGASRWEEDKSKRHVGDGIVVMLNNRFQIIDKLVMPDVGPVCDIRVIDELDLAHNGVEF